MDAFQQSPAVGAECGILLHIVDIYRGPLDRRTAEMGLAQPDPPFAQPRHPLGTHAKGGFGHKDFLGLVELVDGTFIRLRELRGPADDRGEHSVEIERGIDRAHYFFERLQFGDRAGQLVSAGLQFAIGLGGGDRDDRLLSEGLQQLDLTVGEAADLPTSHRHRADRRSVAQQRQRYLRLVTEIAHGRANSGFARDVAHMNDLPVENRPAGDGIARRHHRKQPPVGFLCLGRAVHWRDT